MLFFLTAFAKFSLNPQFANKLRMLILYWLLNSPNSLHQNPYGGGVSSQETDISFYLSN